MHSKDADRVADSVDPDQSSLIWVFTVCPDLGPLTQSHHKSKVTVRQFRDTVKLKVLMLKQCYSLKLLGALQSY